MPATPEVPPAGARPWRLLALALACAVLVLHGRRPPAAAPDTAPATAFSAQRAMRHLGVIAQRPHPIGSPDAARVRTYLLATLDSLGLSTEVQEVTAVGTRYQELGHVRNIVARLAGTQPGGTAVLLMSHYDGVPAGPAASDAGSGVSVILEVLRALRAGGPRTHDVLVLLSDGEEAGLLGASAFVREHRWAKDVAVTLNFEARGTRGRASMFETGPGNFDLVRLLRHAPDVTASSLIVTVYRTLNNDTDLSEVSRLDRPALNFAFADGVDRYHTTEDDTLHIDPGSMQQEGAQALQLVRALADGPLPRPVTGDAVFSDLVPFGVVYYGEGAARPLLALLVIGFVAAILQLRRREARWGRDTLAGVVLTLLMLAAGGALALGASQVITRVHASVGGNAAFATVYAVAIVLLALAGAVGCWSVARRWCSAAGLHHGVLLVWLVLAALASIRLPGASFVVVWPLAVALVAVLVPSNVRVVHGVVTTLAGWIALAVLVPLIAQLGPVLLGVVGPGGILTGVLVALLVSIIAPLLESMWPRGGRLALVAGGAGVLAMLVGAMTVRATAAHPVPSVMAYAIDADSGDAWLVAPGSIAKPGTWTTLALGDSVRVGVAGDSGAAALPAWLGVAVPFGDRLAARRVPRVTIAGPVATVLRDTTSAAGRELTLRIVSPAGVLATSVQVAGHQVRRASVDGRMIDTSRFRRSQADWEFTFAAPPDSGFTLAFVLDPSRAPALEVTSLAAGVPALPGVTIPPRPVGTVVIQTGDISAVRRRVRL